MKKAICNALNVTIYARKQRAIRIFQRQLAQTKIGRIFVIGHRRQRIDHMFVKRGV